jgi:hypothetical protein
MSEEAQEVIRADAVLAKRFDLVDKDGETRVTFGTTPDGQGVAANFYDAQGVPRIVFAVQEEGNATISLVDHEQKERIRISSGAMGNAITVYDRDERTRLLLQLEPDSEDPQIHFVDESGNPQILMTQIGRDPQHPSPLIAIREEDGTYRQV